MSYDPKAKRPDTDDSEHAAPVDQLLGATPTAEADTRSAPVPAPVERDPAAENDRADPPLPEPVVTRRTARNMVAAAVAVAVVLVGWRLRRRR